MKYVCGVMRSKNTDTNKHKVVIFEFEEGNVVNSVDYPDAAENLVQQH